MNRLLALLLGTTIGALIVAAAWRMRHPPTPMRDVEIRVVDTRGTPVENFRWSYFDETPGAVISPYVPQGRHPGGVTIARVPEHRISIDIEADQLHSTRFGPFEPNAIPRRIDAALADVQVIAGTVIYSGQPIGGAQVELLLESPDVIDGVSSGFFYGNDDLRTTSDGNGGFRIGSDWPYPYFVRAWKAGYAPGILGPVHPGDPPIEVKLHDGGTIEGALRLPDGRAAEGVEVELYREEANRDDTSASRGERFFASAGPNSRFRFEHIDVGPWLLRVRGASGIDHVPFVVDVTERATTQFDMDLTRPPIEIEGRLTLNGEPISHAGPRLLLLGAKALCVDGTVIDGDERFVLFTRMPGKYRLFIGCNHHHDVRQPRYIADVIDVPEAGARWQHDIVYHANDAANVVLNGER